MSFETILPFLQPIAHLVTDTSISEIMVNGNQSVFIQRNGRVEPVAATVEQKYLVNAVKRIARSFGEDISEAKPLLDARLPEGSRVVAAFPPCSLYGVTLTIRKFRPSWVTLAELVTAGALPASVADQFAAAVLDRRTILVSGGTDTGKTTFTTALLGHTPQSKRLAIIEDTMELRVDHLNTIRFDARRSQTDADGNITVPAVSIRDLVKATLRHRRDQLIVGEVRGAEAFDLLDALNTGHAGSISTIHANSATMALSRLASLALRAGVDIPYVALQRDIGELIDIVVDIERREGRRFVSEALRIEGIEHATTLFNAR